MGARQKNLLISVAYRQSRAVSGCGASGHLDQALRLGRDDKTSRLLSS